MAFYLKHFIQNDPYLFVTEFGYSCPKSKRTVGPWSRGIYLLHFVVKGSCDFSGFHVEKGHAFLIAKEHLHSFTVCDDYEHYWIGVSGTAIEKIFKDFAIDCNRHQLFFVQIPEVVQTLFSDTKKRLMDDDSESADRMVLSLFLSLLPLLKSERESPMPSKINYAERVQRFIETNYIYPIKMIDIAKELHLSEKYMYRLFKEKFHIPPQKYLLKTRMESARTLLTRQHLSVKEVAHSVGYTSLPAFTKAFSHYWGQPPSFLKNNSGQTPMDSAR